MRLLAALAGAILLVAPSRAGAQEAQTGAQPARGGAPTTSDIKEVRLIRADSMSLTQREGEPQVLRGDVEVIVIGQDDRESRIQATKISMYTGEGTNEIDRLVAEGKVVMEREGMVAKTELAIYDGRQNTVDLLQDNYVSDPRGELTADRIRVNLATNHVAAEGNVRGTVYPKELRSPDDGRK